MKSTFGPLSPDCLLRGVNYIKVMWKFYNDYDEL